MSYKLEYPYTEDERLEFIIEYNHNQGLKIETVERTILTEELSELVVDYYALEANEIMVDNEPVIDPDYELKQEQVERERIAHLNLTGADVERGIYQAKGMDFDDIVEMVEMCIAEGTPPPNPLPQGAGVLDIKALKIELKANHFYRGNPYVDAIGGLLGFTSEQLDKFFEDGNYQHLLVVE